MPPRARAWIFTHHLLFMNCYMSWNPHGKCHLSISPVPPSKARATYAPSRQFMLVRLIASCVGSARKFSPVIVFTARWYFHFSAPMALWISRNA